MTILWENEGYCHCCRQQVIFQARGPALRSEYYCTNCQSRPRHRHVQYVLDRHFPGWEKLKIHESSPANSYIRPLAANYSYSFFWPDVKRGEYRNGIQCQDLEQLTFPDEVFDIMVTMDVLEHLFSPQRALLEITRVLRPGGFHIFTAPIFPNRAASFQRATLQPDGSIVNHQPPAYHGNPIGDHKALVTWDFGRDAPVLFAKWSGLPTTVYLTVDRAFGLEAQHLEVFVCQKY